MVLFVVGPQLHSIPLGNLECEFKRVDRVKPQPLAEQWRLRIDVGRPDVVEIDRRNDQLGERLFGRGLR